MTYLELLQMVAEGTQPKRIKLEGLCYIWDGCEYTCKWDEKTDYRLSYKLSNWTTKGQTTADFIEVIQEILTEEERSWLAVAISPFASEVVEICKASSDKYECLFVTYRIDDYEDTLRFPYFKEGEHFKGMVKWKNYSPKELDL